MGARTLPASAQKATVGTPPVENPQLVYKLDTLGHVTSFVAIAIFAASLVTLLAAEPEISVPPPNPQAQPKWEDEILNGYLPYHQLTAEDFPVKDNLRPGMAYWIEPFLHYYYGSIGRGQQGTMYAYVKDWTVFSGFNKNLSGRKSGFRGMKDELLYAQSLLDLNELYARRLAALQPAEFPRGTGRTWPEAQRQLEEGIEKLCQMQMTEERKEAETLAKATNNGQNKKRVRELSAAIKKRLAQVTPASTPTAAPSPQPGMPLPIIPPPAQLSSSPK